MRRFAARFLLVVVAVILGGCDNPKHSDAAVDNSTTPNVEPIVIRTKSPPTSFIPTQIVDIPTRDIAALVHAGLVGLNEDGSATVNAVLSEMPNIIFEKETGQAILEFRLKDSSTFHDGSPVTPANVLYSFKSVLKSGSPFTYTLHPILGAIAFEKGEVDDLAGFSVVDTKAFSLKIHAASDTEVNDFLFGLASGINWIVKSGEFEREDLGTTAKNLITAGPYKLVSQVEGREYIFESRQQPTQQIKFVVTADPSTAVLQYKKGEIDVLEIDDLSIANSLLGKNRPSSAQTITSDANRLVYLLWNPDQSNAERILSLSHSLSQAMDTSLIAKSVYPFDLAKGASRNEWYPIRFGLPPKEEVATDIAEEQDFSDLTINLVYEGNAYNTAIADIVSDLIVSKGAKVNKKSREFGSWIQAVLNKQYTATIMVIEANMYGPAFWSSMFNAESALNIFGHPLQSVAGLVESRSWLDIEDEVISSAYVNPILIPQKAFMTSDRISGPALDANGQVLYSTITAK